MTDDFIYPADLKYNNRFFIKVSKKNRNPSLILGMLFLLVSYCNFISCTYNPLFPLKKTEQTSINGTVQMSDQMSPEKTFVWMEDFNLSCYLEQDGEFDFTLSPAVSQGLSGGVSGIFAIYFYHPNYFLDSIHVKLIEGKIAKNQQNFDDDGCLKSNIRLIKFFSHSVSIDTIAKKDKYPAKSKDDSLRVTVKLHAFKQNVTVKTRIWNKPVPGTTTNALRRSGVYFYSQEYNHLYQYLNIDSFNYEYVIPAGKEVIWDEYVLPLWNDGFYSTDYSVVPFIYPKQTLPERMLYKMGKNKIEFSPEYLELPLQVDTCMIHIDGSME